MKNSKNTGNNILNPVSCSKRSKNASLDISNASLDVSNATLDISNASLDVSNATPEVSTIIYLVTNECKAA